MALKPLGSAALMLAEEKQELENAITEWWSVAQKVAELSDREKELRTEIFDKYFAANPNLKEGTNHINLDYGKMLTADYRINRKVDEAQLDAAIALGKIPRTIVDDLINYKPALKVGEWRLASPEVKQLFGDIITEQPGQCGLKITTPKQ